MVMNVPSLVSKYLPPATPEKDQPVRRVGFFDKFSRSREATAEEIFTLKLQELDQRPVGVLGLGEYHQLCTMLHDFASKPEFCFETGPNVAEITSG